MLILFVSIVIISNIEVRQENEFFIPNIQFSLYTIKDKLISNTKWEYTEQELLGEFIRPTDNVLQLGGNIGASCIYVDKLIDKNNINICVEPNNKVISTLEKNKNLNNSPFRIIHGVISNDNNLKLSNKNQKVDLNFWGSKISKDGDTKVKSYSLTKIMHFNKINVLFADCEGCLEKFIDEYTFFLKQLRLVIYEVDNTKNCNYPKIEHILQTYNFKNVKNKEHCKVWTK